MKFWLCLMLALVKFFDGRAAETNPPAVIANLFAAPKPAVTNAPVPSRTFDVRGYLIEGNYGVLPPEKFTVLSNYTGTVNFGRVREGLGVVQLLYRDLGFVTVSVTLPQQKLTNGVVRVKVVEGKLAKIKVDGNRWFSTPNVLRALPSLDTNILLNTKWFQPELDRANQNPDRQIYPVISPGLDPGTSDLTLQVKDRFPLHGHMEINDKSTPGTPLLRLDTAIQYNNLWQLNHQIGFDYNFSPQQMKDDSFVPQFYNQPMIASYSTYYRLPLGTGHGLRENYDDLPVDFGYDEVSHRFNLPPATGNPDLIFYASGSSSDTPVQSGPVTHIFSNVLAEVNSQFQQRNPAYNYNLGSKFTLPIREFLGVQSSLLMGFDYKYYQSQTYSTNLTSFDLYGIDAFGNRVLVTNQVIRFPANSSQQLYYLPLSLGWVASRPDSQGAFSFNFNESFFFAPFGSSRTNFQSVAGSSKAGGNYTTINAGLIRLQNLPGNWSAVLNANGQWASEPLISNEQFALGGTSGVRGYQDGANYGDTGWRTLFDLRAPPVNVGYFPTQHGDVPAHLRPSIFMDYGQTYHLEQSAPCIKQWGTGAGFYLTAGEHFEARLTLAWALQSTPQGASVGSARAYFNVGFQF